MAAITKGQTLSSPDAFGVKLVCLQRRMKGQNKLLGRQGIQWVLPLPQLGNFYLNSVYRRGQRFRPPRDHARPRPGLSGKDVCRNCPPNTFRAFVAEVAGAAGAADSADVAPLRADDGHDVGLIDELAVVLLL